MKEYTLQSVEDNGLLLFKYIRGSHAFGLNTETSDIDTGGVYIAEQDVLYGIRGDYSIKNEYQTQLASEKNDDVLYEVGAYVELLMKSNPTALEGLFVQNECITYMHPLFKKLRDNRDMFVSKDALMSFSKYAISQIKKARGLNKKIVNEVLSKKEVLDFCYTFDEYQGSIPLRDWLARYGLKQKYCGCNHVSNWERTYNAYYDWQEHIHLDWKSADEFIDAVHNAEQSQFMVWLFKNQLRWEDSMNSIPDQYIARVYNEAIPKGYHGVQREDGTSCDVRLDSIVKGDTPLCHFNYNDNGFQTHCRQYKEYQEWLKKRNPVRYECNLGHNYDSKNISTCIRLLTMSLEMAENKGLILDRRVAGDRDYLLAIKNHQFEYEEVIAKADELEEKLQAAIPTCNLPEHVNIEAANQLLKDIRTEFYAENSK